MLKKSVTVLGKFSFGFSLIKEW